MSSFTQGTTAPVRINRFAGSDLQPIVIRVAGGDRRLLEKEPALIGPSVYIATFDGVGGTEAYVGMTRCGQDRPRTGQHLVWPDPADHIHVITDANGGLSVKDARVLERLMFAKLAEVTDWRLRQDEIPIASSVGGERFGDLMQFGAAALRLLKLRFGLFGDLCERRLLTLPREHEPIIYDLLRNGPPRGEEKILVSFGIVARGIDLGEAGFVIRKGSQVRSQVVGSSVQLNGARREELFFGGLLERQGEELFVVRRDLWRPSATSAARFVSGSSASASAWHACAPPPSRLRLV